jgi:hypothetical protein
VSKKVTTTVYITEDQQRLLKELNRVTKVPISEYIREGIDLIIDRNRTKLSGQMELSEVLAKSPASNKGV